MGRNIAFKMQFGENILAQQMTDIKRSLCSQQIPFIDAYMEMDPRGIVKCGHTTVTKKLAALVKQVNIQTLWFYTLEKKKTTDEWQN